MKKHPPEHFVPKEEYKYGILNDDISSRFDDIVDALSQSESHNSDPSEYGEFKKNVIKIATRKWGKWHVSQSERTVISVGQTVDGGPIFPGDTDTGIVVKFNPILRKDGEYESPRECGNLAELQIWKHAVDSGIDEWFGTIFDYADDGSWIVMKEYIPYYKYNEPDHTNTYIHRTSERIRHEYGNVLRGILIEHGIDPHVKRGNVGLQPTTNGYKPVSIDYTSHTDHEYFDWTEDPSVDLPGGGWGC